MIKGSGNEISVVAAGAAGTARCFEHTSLMQGR
jgi:hypothetical protein